MIVVKAGLASIPAVTKEGFVPAELKVRKGSAVEIEFTPDRNGQIKYACAMGMVGSVLLVE